METRLLIVEADPVVALGLQWALEASGATVHIIPTGADVLAAIERFQPEVVLFDLAPPEHDGHAIHARIARRCEVPIIFSSGHLDDGIVKSLVTLPRTAFIRKPYSTQELQQVIEQLLHRRSSPGASR